MEASLCVGAATSLVPVREALLVTQCFFLGQFILDHLEPTATNAPDQRTLHPGSYLADAWLQAAGKPMTTPKNPKRVSRPIGNPTKTGDFPAASASTIQTEPPPNDPHRGFG